MPQSAEAILMIRPSGFGLNPETTRDNEFQSTIEGNQPPSDRILQSFDSLVSVLRANEVRVEVWQEPPGSPFPDAVFPNNWLSTHENGAVCLYPLMPSSRRGECRAGVIEWIAEQGYQITEVVDFRKEVAGGEFLEGTGSLVLDRDSRLAFASISERTNQSLVMKWCERFEYRPVVFHTLMHSSRLPVYHTNVLLSIGTTWAVVCPEVIASADERAMVMNAIEATGRVIIPISLSQLKHFCGNVLELLNRKGERLLIISDRALSALTIEQRARIGHHARLIHADVPHFEELGGGSVRCMMAELFLPRVNFSD